MTCRCVSNASRNTTFQDLCTQTENPRFRFHKNIKIALSPRRNRDFHSNMTPNRALASTKHQFSLKFKLSPRRNRYFHSKMRQNHVVPSTKGEGGGRGGKGEESGKGEGRRESWRREEGVSVMIRKQGVVILVSSLTSAKPAVALPRVQTSIYIY